MGRVSLNIEYVKFPIVIKPFSRHNVFKAKILKKISELNCSRLKDSNNSIESTDWNIENYPQDSYINLIFPELKKDIDLIVDTAYKSFPDLIYKNIWFQKYVKGDTHSWHRHPDSTLSIIYYLELPDSAPLTSFIAPDTTLIKQIQAKEGDIVVFPSSLLHSSLTNKSNYAKTIIGINLQ